MLQTTFSFKEAAPARVFLWWLVCVVIGAAAAPYLEAPVLLLAAAAAVLVLLAIVIKRPGRIIVILLVGLVIGWWRYEAAAPRFDQTSVVYATGQPVTITGVVVAEVDRRVDHVKLTVAVELVNDNQANGRLLIAAPLYPRVAYGDRVSARCTVRRPQQVDDFPYDRYLALKGVYAICSTRAIRVLDHDQGRSPLAKVLAFKAGVIHSLNRLLPEPHASFLAGLLVGARRGIPDSLLEAFNRTGTTHIIAISGYNITIVAAVVLAACRTLIGRKRAFWLVLIALVVFVIITGAQASVVRAAIMGVLVLLARQLGRASQITNAFFLAAVIMILINPLVLRDDAGFQLSFLATAGLIYLSPRLERMFRFVPAVFGLRESLTATVSATIMTLPLIAVQFDRISIVAPLVNMLILPFIPLAMALGFGAVLAALIWWPLGQVIGWLVWLVLEYIITLVSWFAHWSMSTIGSGSLSPIAATVAFALLARLIWRRLELWRPLPAGFRYEKD